MLAAHWAETWVPGSIGLLLTGVPLAYSLRELCLGFAAYTWPKVPAKVVSSQVVVRRQRARYLSGQARITYTYEVDGVKETCERIKFGQFIEANLGIAEALVRKYPIGAQATVRVKGKWATLQAGPSGWLFIWIPILAFVFGAILYELLTGTPAAV